MTTSLFSLLWPNGQETPSQKLPTHTIQDLQLSSLITAIAWDANSESFTRQVLTQIVSDVEIILYRQGVLEDILQSPNLARQLETILDIIADMQGYLSFPQWQENTLQHVAWRLSELERYVDCIKRLQAYLDAAQGSIQSSALQKLRKIVTELIEEESFQGLQAELPEFIRKIRSLSSITIGINLDEEMRPLSAILLSVHSKPFGPQSFFTKLFGKVSESPVGALHSARQLHNGGHTFQVELRDRNSPFMPALFKDLSILMDDVCHPIAIALRRYIGIHTQFLITLRHEIAFYLGAARWIKRMQSAGWSLSRPQIVPIEERLAHYTDLYNINLALQNQRQPHNIVANDVHFNEQGRIFILTGPNQGGKTTYTQAVGLAQLLFQAGLHVPARSAIISPVDNIYTHFAAPERPHLEAGRLGEEAQRLVAIFDQGTRYSLVLLNESLASTSSQESSILARDIVMALRLLGVRAIFVTHLHTLAEDCETMNAETTGDSRIISMVSLVHIHTNGIQRTYRIIPAPPTGHSYASELAERFGIRYEQLAQKLKQREQI